MHQFQNWLLSSALSGALLTSFAAAQTLVRDINAVVTNAGSNAAEMYDTGLGFAVFAANNGSIGTELWRTNGTLAGTTLVRDINTTSATASSSPTNFFAFAGRTYFSATDGTNGTELWATDGTAAGTVLVKDINTGTGSSFPSQFLLVGPLVVFSASNGTAAGVGQGTELWTTDGTAAGTTLVRDINPGTASSSPSNFAVFNGYAYFSANDGANGTELWRTDGTFVNTSLFLDINVTTLTASSSPTGLATIGTRLWMRATDGFAGTEVWTSDGTVVGTTMLLDIRSGATGSAPSNFRPIGANVAFVADDGVNGAELWVSNGTGAGTQLLLDINPGTESGPVGTASAFANVGSTLFFAASNGNAANGFELWKTDGTTANTVLVKDINPGTAGSTASPMIAYGAGIVFAAQDSNGMELWVSDGTTSGTTLVANINPLGNSAPNSFATLGGQVLFAATDGFSGNELWRTDATNAGTFMVRDINPPLPNTGASSPTNLTRYGNLLIFAANDGISGTEVWRTDGTTAGTVLVKDIAPGSTGWTPANFYVINGVVLFTALDGSNGSELWRTDGTTAGTFMVKDLNPGSGGGASSTASGFAVLDGILFFNGNDGTTGSEPARSDGTAAGTYIITDLNPGTGGSVPFPMLAWSGRVYMQATDGTTGFELFATDGTAAGTVLVKDVRPGSTGSSATNFTAGPGGMLFTANEGTTAPESGTELWLTDGTTAGTVLVKDINPGTASSSPSSLTAFAGALFFAATDGSNGIELWRTDGSTAGTTMLIDLNTGSASASPAALGVVNGKLVFRATNGTTGNELFASDGTAAGTGLVLDMWTGSSAGFTGTSTVVASSGNRALFCATNGTTGSELWSTDGTAAGTQNLFDLAPGATGGVTGPIVRVLGNRAYFAGNDGVLGTELWSMPLRLYGGAVVETFGTGCLGAGNVAPRIGALDLPRTGATFTVTANSGRANSPCVLIFAGARNDVTIGACTIHPDLGSSVSITLGTSAGGTVSAPLPIPPLTSFVGAALWFQWAVADPAGQLLGVASLSDGMLAVIGAP